MMERSTARRRWSGVLGVCAAAIVLLWHAPALAFSLQVVGPSGEPVTSYRWTVEADETWHPVPGVSDPETLGVSFHRSYMPVLATGDQTTSAAIALPSDAHYFVTVLPAGGYALGGAQVAPGQSSARVVVNRLPLPTAQISVMAFEDNFSINNALDQPQELGLPGFTVVVEEAGGRYGISGGVVSQDAFGNPLGTTYRTDASGNPILDGDGAPIVQAMGSGVIVTDAQGEALIKNLSPGKYGIRLVPPTGQTWIQTTTIEGTKVTDAWVKANEPPYFQEFGPPSWHVTVGFVRPMYDASRLTGASTISGQVVNQHLSRPPDTAFYDGAPFDHTTCWIGLNEGTGAGGRGLVAMRCNGDGTFSIPNVPAGTYQLVVWDDNLDLIIASLGVEVPPGGGPVQLGNVPVFNWFARLHMAVFSDANENGQWEPEFGEMGLPDVPVNIRFRDGSLYQSMTTDTEGWAPLDEVFPFFNWLVAEVDYSRMKATGATIVVDAGGPVDPTDPWSFDGKLNPQIQSGTNLPYRVEQGPVLLEAFQALLGQTNVIQWGKKPYLPGENGGITGVVYYSTTRAEDDPRFGVAEPWEPGIPRVQVNLYASDPSGGGIADNNVSGAIELADVDNAPFGFRIGDAPGPEDIDRDADGQFDNGDALQITWTDSWDDAQPSDCPGDPTDPFFRDGRCYDGMRNWNQVRPGVFDGGYAFTDLAPGLYVVEAVPPRGPNGATYEIVKEEDKNVVFGDSYVPAPMLVPPACVGDLHPVPTALSLFPDQAIPPVYAGQMRPLCDRKEVLLSDQANAAADFFVYTKAPIAGHVVGMVLDDTANEFDPAAPTFGEKYAPPFLPISIRDWTGREIGRVYSDEWGTYNALVPSTYSADRPLPSGMAPQMLIVCLNDPALPDPAAPGGFRLDPQFNPKYSQFCYTFQYMPGTTTYLDTPVVRVSAFAGPDQTQLDCQLENGTPRIFSVTTSGPGGPWVAGAGAQIVINSMGTVQVPNPQFDPPAVTQTTIARDYGFGSVRGRVTVNGTALTINSWNDDTIVATLPSGVGTGQLLVERGDAGRKVSPVGVTLTVGGSAPLRVATGGSIQQAIDNASPGQLILVPPGNYDEAVIMWKPVKLQGWGAGSTVINARKLPTEKLQAWRTKARGLVESGAVDLSPGQELGFGGVEPATFNDEEGAGILVLGRDVNPNRGGYGLVGGQPNARIDGLTVTGGDHGGGIVVNAWAHYLAIGNLHVVNNTGFYGGGIRVGHPALLVDGNQGPSIPGAENDHVRIHHSWIAENGGLDGAGGGVALYSGSDAYQVTDNYVCGNFTTGHGGGLGHLGLSDGGVVARNSIVFNQSFNQGLTVSGGGVFVGGEALPGNALSPGAGSVLIEANLLQGNQAGAGHGGAIRIAQLNGADVSSNRNQPNRWYHARLYDNVIVDNIAALAGGGLSLQDAARVTVIHNTIAHNDSTATGGEAFTLGNPKRSTAQPAGVVGHAHSALLAAAIGPNSATAPYREFSNPTLTNNIIWHNRSQFFVVDDSTDPPTYTLQPRQPSEWWDLAVVGTATQRSLNPTFCILSDTTGYAASNRSTAPGFVRSYQNGSRGWLVLPESTTAIQPAPAFDEGGNFIDIHFGPLTRWDPTTGALLGDYHLLDSPSVAKGTTSVLSASELATDFDGQPRPRPVGSSPEIGADELQTR